MFGEILASFHPSDLRCMRADIASDAHEGEHAFSSRGQNTAMIADLTREIKSHAT
jgi:hypothetical protein